MTDSEINVAISEACGWVADIESTYPHRRVWSYGQWQNYTDQDLPNYSTDLNAMHEAEKTILTGNGWKENLAKYSSKLMSVMHDTDFGRIDVAFKNDMVHLRYFTLHATARQRAEAFLRTIGKWREEEKS